MLYRIVKIQAAFRGFYVRKLLDETGKYDEDINDSEFLKNQKVKAVYDREGPYKIQTINLGDDPELVDESVPLRLLRGPIYKGQFNRYRKCRKGFGRQVWPDGTYFEGQWKNGSIHGLGRMIYSFGDMYEGEWKLGKAHGEGKYIHDNGTLYKGNFANDKMHGNGTMIHPDGRVLNGTWKRGQQNGEGIFTSAFGVSQKGIWKDGQAVYYYTNEDSLNNVSFSKALIES